MCVILSYPKFSLPFSSFHSTFNSRFICTYSCFILMHSCLIQASYIQSWWLIQTRVLFEYWSLVHHMRGNPKFMPFGVLFHGFHIIKVIYIFKTLNPIAQNIISSWCSHMRKALVLDLGCMWIMWFALGYWKPYLICSCNWWTISFGSLTYWFEVLDCMIRILILAQLWNPSSWNVVVKPQF